MKPRVYILEEYIGDFDRCSDQRNFIGVYRKKKQALKAKEEHLESIDKNCISGYCLTCVKILKKGFQYCYMTEDLGR